MALRITVGERDRICKRSSVELEHSARPIGRGPGDLDPLCPLRSDGEALALPKRHMATGRAIRAPHVGGSRKHLDAMLPSLLFDFDYGMASAEGEAVDLNHERYARFRDMETG